MNLIREADISTAFEMKSFFCNNLSHLRVGDMETETHLEFWKRLVRASTGDGKYILRHPTLMVAACSSPPPNIACVQLPNDISSPDPLRVAWYACTFSLSISPPTWKLTEELEEVDDPPSVCRIRVELSNLVFKGFVNDGVEYLKRKEISHFTIFHQQINTHYNVCRFLASFKYMEGIYHAHITPQTTERIWFDLINKSRHGKNVYIMALPFLVRVASNVPKSLEDQVHFYPKEQLIKVQSFPEHMDPDSFIGLYTGLLTLSFYANADSILPLVNRELWPDIPLVYSDIKQHDGCYVNLAIQHLKFVSTVTEEQIRCFIPAETRGYAVFNKWFKTYVNIFNNL
jgi:hypothetical protein